MQPRSVRLLEAELRRAFGFVRRAVATNERAGPFVLICTAQLGRLVYGAGGRVRERGTEMVQ
jgi:hypothetical protein